MIVCITSLLSGSVLAVGFCAGFVPVTAENPRSSIAVDATDFLALDRGTSSKTDTGDQETREKKTETATTNHSLRRVINRTPEEVSRIQKEHAETLDAQRMYDHATWRMYNRIVNHRKKKPPQSNRQHHI